MDQFAQTNDLQQAINSIANGGATTNNDVSQFGIPPMPPMPENGNTMPEVKPLVPVEDAAPAAESNTQAASEPSAEQILSQGMGTEAMPSAPASEAAPATETITEESAMANEAEAVSESAPAEDLSDVKQSILKDLLPLLDKTEKTPEEKFEIYKDALETMHDVKTIEGAYKTATQISDEAKKAEALFDVMKVIDTQ